MQASYARLLGSKPSLSKSKNGTPFQHTLSNWKLEDTKNGSLKGLSMMARLMSGLCKKSSYEKRVSERNAKKKSTCERSAKAGY